MSSTPEDRSFRPDPTPSDARPSGAPEVSRRGLFSSASRAAMGAGLVAGYGTAGVMAGRYLYPADERALRWVFVCTLDRLGRGDSLVFVTPLGERVTVARQGDGESVEDFVALSSTCPHLGCQVHWQGARDRFFCPCHNGVFDPTGKALEGPPADAGTDLPRYPLEVRDSMLFMRVPIEGLTADTRVARVEEPPPPTGPGHDPCLGKRS